MNLPDLPEDEMERYYAEMCRVVGDAVFVLAEADVETTRAAIVDALRTAMKNRMERSDEMVRCMEAAVRTLDF